MTLDQPPLGNSLTASLAPQGQGIVHMVTSRRRAAIKPVLAQMPISERADLVTALRAFARAASEASLRDLWAMGWTQ